ncbi:MULTISPECIES: hypothetical protein [unclassified Arthrobacter]|uniref:hypothetical protein n=1 Tax=unclassified Arthrobacter TaxID=235627 RepID=UPI001D14FB7D|nr:MULTISPECIES: hypothetical protein [unclassified Arthrobacter]MCC3275282.1 hypothetical protein [Arthrobacter sp. zg-Y20]MCC3278357.1 hypothetical protein [Arthrobacter sp. zg-Y40]MCC9176728.1 hypothetical protein [Arthrobacter sp. zg-Y750]MDK1315439.1 hypothetical protein [Arthrobacter sp. zg.Y20]MDK1326566.1 hypothetical protein [Arthrobacter sp. zg-Y1143]
MPTREEIDAARTPSGGFTKQQLAEWGISWPPPRGWRRKLEEEVEAAAAAGNQDRIGAL